MDSRNRLWWVMGGVGLLLVVVLTGGLYWLRPVDPAARAGLALPRPRQEVAPFEYVAPEPAASEHTAGATGEAAPQAAGPETATGTAVARAPAGSSDDAAQSALPAGEQAAATPQPIPRVTLETRSPASPDAAPAVRTIPTAGTSVAGTASPAPAARQVTLRSTPATAGSTAASVPATGRSVALAKLEPAAPFREFWVQVGSFASRNRADALGQRLSDQGIVSRVTTRAADAEVFFRVRVGPYGSRLEAEKFLAWAQRVDGLDGSYISEVRTAGG